MPHWLAHLWFGYFWPSLQGNGPEALVQTVVYGAIAVILVPAARRFVKRETAALHRKVDHVIFHSRDIPPYHEPREGAK